MGADLHKLSEDIVKMAKLVAIFTLATLGMGSPHEYHTSSKQVIIECRTEYITLWDTKYKETETQQCTTEYEKSCKTEYERVCKTTYKKECQTLYEKQCQAVYKNVCVEQYRTEYEPYTETECSTQYKEDCEYQWEGSGNEKVWVPIPGTCKKNPYDECKDVSKTKAKQVAYPVCNDVPEQKCVDVPKQECVSVPEQICTNKPYQTCVNIPKQSCVTVHKKVPVRFSKQVPKKTCDDDTAQYSAGVTEATANVSLAGILGLININERRAVTEVDAGNETTTENIVTGPDGDQDFSDSFVFL